MQLQQGIGGLSVISFTGTGQSPRSTRNAARFASNVMRIAAETGVTPYDVPNVELGHHGDRCSFDAFISKRALQDAALNKLALIVRGADCWQPDLVKEAAGLFAISNGLSLNFSDDHEMLAHGLVSYDALYAWCGDTPLKKVGRLPRLT